MSESENCAEQREEPTELEEAGGPEVRRALSALVTQEHVCLTCRRRFQL